MYAGATVAEPKRKTLKQEPVKQEPAKRGRKPSPEGRRVTFTFKCRPEFKDWVGRYAKTKRIPPSFLIDQALTRIAELDGFEAPPER